MSDSAAVVDDEIWQPPATYRASIADAERIAGDLVDVITAEPSMLIDRQRVEFLARRLLQLTTDNHDALPPEVF